MGNLEIYRNYAIIFIYTALFGTAAWDKLKTFQTPEWFVKQFEKTFVAKLPGGAKVNYWIIAVLELCLALLFLSSALNFALLPLALCASLFLFGILLIGLRVTYDFQGSANMFIYFGTTLLSLFLVQLGN